MPEPKAVAINPATSSLLMASSRVMSSHRPIRCRVVVCVAGTGTGMGQGREARAVSGLPCVNDIIETMLPCGRVVRPSAVIRLSPSVGVAASAAAALFV